MWCNLEGHTHKQHYTVRKYGGTIIKECCSLTGKILHREYRNRVDVGSNPTGIPILQEDINDKGHLK